MHARAVAARAAVTTISRRGVRLRRRSSKPGAQLQSLRKRLSHLPAFKLSPADCHRLHAPVTGRISKLTRLGMRYMASGWVAVHSSLDVMTENAQLVIEFETQDFGTVAMVHAAFSQPMLPPSC